MAVARLLLEPFNALIEPLKSEAMPVWTHQHCTDSKGPHVQANADRAKDETGDANPVRFTISRSPAQWKHVGSCDVAQLREGVDESDSDWFSVSTANMSSSCFAY